MMMVLLEGFGDGEHFVGAGADAKVFGEIAPANGAGGIDEELSGAGDVGAVRSAGSMQQMILPDHLGFGIAEDGKCVSRFGGKIARLGRRVHADGYGADARGLEFGEIFFDAS
jgi:hypothetical protein